MNNSHNRLTIISNTDPLVKKSGKLEKRVLCKCSCGKEVKVLLYNLNNGNTKSCGCLKSELTSARSKTHGMSKSSIYSVYSGMKSRCYYKNNPAYKNYGGRGITICNEWLDNPSLFIKWAVSNGYSTDLQIDRIDNDKGYSPSNCQFITLAENVKNTQLIQRNNKSGFRGVHFAKNRASKHKKWQASAAKKTIGYFKTAEEAAVARDNYVIKNNLGLPLNFPV